MKGVPQSRGQETRPLSKNLISLYDMAMGKKDHRPQNEANEQQDFKNGLGKSVQPLTTHIQSTEIQRLHSSGLSPTEAKNMVSIAKMAVSNEIVHLVVHASLDPRLANTVRHRNSRSQKYAPVSSEQRGSYNRWHNQLPEAPNTRTSSR